MFTTFQFSCSVGETMNGDRIKSKYWGRNLDDEDEWHQFRNGTILLFTPNLNSFFCKIWCNLIGFYDLSIH